MGQIWWEVVGGGLRVDSWYKTSCHKTGSLILFVAVQVAQYIHHSWSSDLIVARQPVKYQALWINSCYGTRLQTFWTSKSDANRINKNVVLFHQVFMRERESAKTPWSLELIADTVEWKRMEQIDNPAPESNNPNGFVNRVFNVSLDMENGTSSVYIQETGRGPAEGQGEAQAASFQTPVKDRQEVNRRPRATGGIWKILNRKRAASELERRPHSMILLGESSIPKLSFADKVRSFKKLKSPSVFRGKTGKLSTGKFSSSLVDEETFCRDIGTPQQTSRGTLGPLRHRGKRHSYAGYTGEFDCSFEDIDLTAPMEEHLPTAIVDSMTQNGFKPSERVSYTKRSHNNSTNCTKTAAGCEEPSVKGSPTTHQGAGRRHKDVWSYLRRISLLGKANPVYTERSFDSELHFMDKTMDSDYGSVDLENLKDFQPLPPKQPDIKGHFGGLFKFFNNVAETARKWRTPSRSFSPPEDERTPVSSPRAPQRTVHNLHSMSVTLHSVGRPKSPLTPSSPLTTKSSNSCSFDSKAPALVTGEGSPKVVLKAFRACSGSQTVNSLQTTENTGNHVDRVTNHGSITIVENHTAHSFPDTEEGAEVENNPLNHPCQEEKVTGHTGNELDSRDAPPDSQRIQEVSVQSQQGDKESSTNSVRASNSTEEIFKVCDLKYKYGHVHYQLENFSC